LSEDPHIAALRRNYVSEVSTRWLYLRLAQRDTDPARKALLQSLAEYEEKHAAQWAAALGDHSTPVPAARIETSHRVLAILGRLFSVGAVFPAMRMGEAEGIEFYRHQLETVGCERCKVRLQAILPEELGHELDLWEHSREGGGGTLRSTVLGANDGLGSILALVAGVAGATTESKFVIIAGVAGLIAGAVSMGASNYISVKSEQDALKAAGEFQRIGLEVAREGKLERLRTKFSARGLSRSEAEHVVSTIAQDEERLLRTLLQEELGVTQGRAERPGRLGAYTFLAFALAGAIPIVPFAVFDPTLGLLLSVLATGIALFLSGVVRTLFTLGSWWKSGVEMLLIGMGSAAATYAVGLLLGARLG